jgi:secreted PhoX family phosphatase
VETLRGLLERRLSRRAVMAGSCELTALSLVAGAAWADDEPSPTLAFATVQPSKSDTVIVPAGYRAQTLVRWGDPLLGGVDPLDPRAVAAGALLEPAAARAQAGQFGYNCDGLAVFPLDDRRALLCVNHEYADPGLLFPGWAEARTARELPAFVRANPSVVAYMQAAVGVSVVEIERGRAWSHRVASRYNRRVTATSPIEIAGPARLHPLLNPRAQDAPVAFGTFGNCASGGTPWGTYLTAEENVDEYFGNGAAATVAADLAAVHARFGFRPRDSVYRWEYADPRFDSALNPAESLKFGWIVEIDPLDPGRAPKKRTALGRLKHECATTTLARDGRVAVYSGDDAQFEYLYKFVTAGRFDPANRDANRDLLDEGTLYVARFFDDGRGEWLPLVFGEHPELVPGRGFASQGDVVLRCREAADRVGATPLDRPEDVAVNPRTGNVYVSCTQNLQRGAGEAEVSGRRIELRTSGVSPRAPNPSGHIVEIAEQSADAAATAFRWEIFVLAGEPDATRLLSALPPEHTASLAANLIYFGGTTDAAAVSAFANPDNLGFDAQGNLWIVTDGAQPGDNNNGCFVCPTEGPGRGAVRQFMSGPVGAELAGCELAADQRTLFLSVQHPGSGGIATAPLSRWPDGGDAAPRPSVIAIATTDGDRPVGS